MKRTTKKLLSVMLALIMTLALVPANAVTDEAYTTLFAAIDPTSGYFSPFFAQTAGDNRVVDMTQISLARYDRAGQMIMNGINGEYRSYNGTEYFYNGAADLSVQYNSASNTTKYTASIRHDLTFSDGVPVTIDDVIFSYYVLLDSDYTGTSTLNSYPIQGVNEYRTQTTTEIYNMLHSMSWDILNAGPNYVCHGSESFTQQQYNVYWDAVYEGWWNVCRRIVDYVVENYGNDIYLQYYIDPDLTAEEFLTTEGNRVAYGMCMWGFGGIERNSNNELFFTDTLGNSWNLSHGEGPTVDDYVTATRSAYDDDVISFYNIEAPDSVVPNPAYSAQDEFITVIGAELMGGATVNSISGIRRVNNWCVEITLDGYSATAYQNVFGISIAPMHYYGSTSMYNYQNGQYGFPRGDLSIVRAKSGSPLGAGPYKFNGYNNGVARFERNESYYLGRPKTRYVSFVEASAYSYYERIGLIEDGSADICDITLNYSAASEIMSINYNGELTGNVITAKTYNNNSYGYIGINADTVNVGGFPGSPASINLRKGFATVIALYRDIGVESYYGVAASVIQYPYCLWATPQPGDVGYRNAFTKDVNGNEIYTAGMTFEQMEDAAIEAARGYFRAAGFTFGSNGRVTSSPAGARTSYEAIVPGDGYGSHPNYSALVNANNLLNRIGFGIDVNDVTNSNDLWDALDSGTQQMWTAAWGSVTDPDLYQVYHSSNIVGLGGTDSNHYHIQSPDLDALIIEARNTVDLNMRKALYKQCLDIIMDWGVNIPVYQLKKATLFSTERVNVNTITPDLTDRYGWMEEIHKLEMAGASQNMPGDVNGDGTVTANDALLVLRAALGLVSNLGSEADVNGDGVVTANDALLILRAALGLASL